MRDSVLLPTDSVRNCIRCGRGFGIAMSGAVISPTAHFLDFEELPGGALRHQTLGYLVTPNAAFYCPICTQRGVRMCRECGCTDEAGCQESCWWVGQDLCSSCVAKPVQPPSTAAGAAGEEPVFEPP